MLQPTSEKWKKVPLADVAEVIMGQAPPGNSYNENCNGILLIAGAADLGIIYPNPKKYTTAPTKLSRNGDIIICVRATIGDLNWADKRQCCYGRGVAAIRPFENVDGQFLFYWLQSSKEHLQGLGRGATFKQISKKNLIELTIPLPPLPEQRRIVSRIKEMMERVDEIRKLREEALKEAEAVIGGVRREYLGTLEMMPEGWMEYRLDNLSDVIYGISDAIAKNKNPSIGPPIIRMANISLDGHLDLSDLRY